MESLHHTSEVTGLERLNGMPRITHPVAHSMPKVLNLSSKPGSYGSMAMLVSGKNQIQLLCSHALQFLRKVLIIDH